jgi:FtsZ-interacting cell division protein YlmF
MGVAGARGVAPVVLAFSPAAVTGSATSATVPNSPHLPQRPNHLMLLAPQEEHSYDVLRLAMPPRLGATPDKAEEQEQEQERRQQQEQEQEQERRQQQEQEQERRQEQEQEQPQPTGSAGCGSTLGASVSSRTSSS